MIKQERFLKYGKKEIINYMENILMIRDDVKEQFNFILSNVDTIRYICLVYRYKLNDNISLYFNFVRTKCIYNGFKVFIINDHCDFKSIQITLPTIDPISSLCDI